MNLYRSLLLSVIVLGAIACGNEKKKDRKRSKNRKHRKQRNRNHKYEKTCPHAGRNHADPERKWLPDIYYGSKKMREKDEDSNCR